MVSRHRRRPARAYRTSQIVMFLVYTVDLLKLAQRDVDLATTEPTLEGVLERRLTATALIARNVFDAVTDHLWKL